MSYENKGTIQDSIIYYYDHVLLYNEYTDDVLDELDNVYAQATKADEYEAKAKAFDAIVEKYVGIMKDVRNRKFKVTSDVTLLGLEAEKVIKKYESGEYDVKK